MQGNNQNNPGQKNQTLSWSQPAAPAGGTSAKTTPSLKTALPAPTSPVSYGRGMLAGTFVLGLVVGVLVGWVWLSQNSITTDVANNSATPTEAMDAEERTTGVLESGVTLPPTATAASGISVGTQAPGLSVAVSNVMVANPTWVVVYESVNGEAGRILGAKLFFPESMGGVSAGTVTLLRATLPGSSYLVGQYRDNGDKQFSTESDTRIMSGGNPLLVSFKTR